MDRSESFTPGNAALPKLFPGKQNSYAIKTDLHSKLTGIIHNARSEQKDPPFSSGDPMETQTDTVTKRNLLI